MIKEFIILVFAFLVFLIIFIFRQRQIENFRCSDTCPDNSIPKMFNCRDDYVENWQITCPQDSGCCQKYNSVSKCPNQSWEEAYNESKYCDGSIQAVNAKIPNTNYNCFDFSQMSELEQRQNGLNEDILTVNNGENYWNGAKCVTIREFCCDKPESKNTIINSIPLNNISNLAPKIFTNNKNSENAGINIKKVDINYQPSIEYIEDC